MILIREHFRYSLILLIFFLGSAALLLILKDTYGATPVALIPPKWISVYEDRGGVNLRWFRVQGAVQYVVQRKSGETGEYNKIGVVSNPAFEDLSVQAGELYFYRVIPVDREGTVGPASEARYYKLEPPEPEIAVPPIWVAHLLEDDGIALSWSHPSSGQVLAYNLFRKAQEDSTFNLLTSTLNTNFRDRSVQRGSTYQYALTALDRKLQESDFSEILKVTFSPPGAARTRDDRFASIKTLEEVVQLTEAVAEYGWEDYGFVSPTDVAYQQSDGILYVSDSGTGLITAIGPEREILQRLGGRGEGPDAFERLLGIAVDGQGNLFAADAYMGEVVVFDRQGGFNRRISLEGEVRRYFGQDLLVKYPWYRFGIVDVLPVSAGGLLVVDNPNSWIYVLDASDRIVKVIGEKGYEPGLMQYPTFIHRDKRANSLVSDTLNSRVQMFGPDGSPVAILGERGLGVGQFLRPKGIAVDGRGNIYVADSQLNVIQVFGSGGEFLSVLGDENGLPLDLGSPNGMVFVEPDLIMICEKLSRKIQVRRVLDLFASQTIVEPEPEKRPTEERRLAPLVIQPQVD